jgi:hypothetical protein
VKSTVLLIPVIFGAAAVLPVAAQSNDPVAQCQTLRHHGDPGANACFQRLTRIPDPAVQAEGFWALRDYKAANDAFRAAVKLHD